MENIGGPKRWVVKLQLPLPILREKEYKETNNNKFNKFCKDYSHRDNKIIQRCLSFKVNKKIRTY